MSAYAYLIYRPVMDYEESMDPHFICSNIVDAERAKSKMIGFATRLAARLPVYPPDEEDPDASKWAIADARRMKMLSNARWPFGINLGSDINWSTSGNEFDPNTVEIMKLKLNP